MTEALEKKKTIHFFDQNNQISERINKLYRSQYKILRKEQYYSLIIIEGLKALKNKDLNHLTLSDLINILNMESE